MASAQPPLVRIVAEIGLGGKVKGETIIPFKIHNQKMRLASGQKVSLALQGEIWEWVGEPPNTLANGSWSIIHDFSFVGWEVRFLVGWRDYKQGDTTIISAVVMRGPYDLQPYLCCKIS